MGLGYCEGVRDRISQAPHASDMPKSRSVSTSRAGPLQRGVTEVAIQGSSHETDTRGSRARFLFKPFSIPQKRRGYEASDKPEGPQRVCGDTPFQNGRSAHTERPSKKKRLDDKDRSEGCILHDPNPQQPQTVSSLLHCPRQLSVQLPQRHRHKP